MNKCHCGIQDWRRLREALGLSQDDMARLLSTSQEYVSYLERASRHRCPHRATVMTVRSWLLHPELRRRLRAARYPYPWPEDLEEPARAPEMRRVEEQA